MYIPYKRIFAYHQDDRNYMKFTVPLAHSITLISWGAIEWLEGYEKANQTRYLHDMLRWGTDWLIKAHPSDNVLFVQVADGDIDNDYWGKYDVYNDNCNDAIWAEQMFL